MLLFCLLYLSLIQTMELKSIQDLQWKNRVLVYFPEKGKSLETKGLEEEMAELKLVWFNLGNDLKTNFPQPMHSGFAHSLKVKFPDLSPGNWVLVGLDGGVKLTGKGDPDWRLIFSTINSMPMRRAETKQKMYF
jgi:hypothetical protein